MGARFPSNPLIIRVPLFLILSLHEETPNYKGKKGTTGVPREPWATLGALENSLGFEGPLGRSEKLGCGEALGKAWVVLSGPGPDRPGFRIRV